MPLNKLLVDRNLSGRTAILNKELNRLQFGEEKPTDASILVVDDSESSRYGIKRYLEHEGYDVEEAASEKQARDALAKCPPDLLVLDVALPDGSGFDFARELRAAPETRLLPIIQISAKFLRGTDYARGLDSGADTYLTQPVEPVVLLATVRSLLQAKRAEAARAHLAAIVENAGEPILSKDLEGRVTSWNSAAEQVFGFSRAEALGRPLTIIIPEELRHEEAEFLAKIKRGERIPQFETVRVTREGKRLDVLLTISPIYDSTGRVVGASKMIRDISRRKKAEEALRRQQDELEERVAERTARLKETVAELEHFSYTITHDMRAPLRAMQAFAQLLEMDYQNCLDDAGRDYLRRIIHSSQRMDHLITDSLNYAKVVRQHLELEPVDIGPLVEGMIESYQEFQPPGADVRVDKSIPQVLGNKAGLTQCFSNLLSNAVKFVAPGTLPTIRVRGELQGGWVRIWVEDNGIGISPRDQARIFAMFQRLSKDHEGTGIGLALVQKVVERMRGRVGVESEPGMGSRFWIELQSAHKKDKPDE